MLISSALCLFSGAGFHPMRCLLLVFQAIPICPVNSGTGPAVSPGAPSCQPGDVHSIVEAVGWMAAYFHGFSGPSSPLLFWPFTTRFPGEPSCLPLPESHHLQATSTAASWCPESQSHALCGLPQSSGGLCCGRSGPLWSLSLPHSLFSGPALDLHRGCSGIVRRLAGRCMQSRRCLCVRLSWETVPWLSPLSLQPALSGDLVAAAIMGAALRPLVALLALPVAGVQCPFFWRVVVVVGGGLSFLIS